MINHETFQLLWPRIKGGIRNLWGRLSDQELEQTNGDLNAVVKIVKSKYTDGEDEIEKKLEQLLDSFDNPSDRDGEPDVSSYHRRPQFEDEPYSNTY